MSQHNNPLEIYKFLQKTNCRQCQAPTCLAFAASVIKGQKRLNDCPHLEKSIIERLNVKIDNRMTFKRQQEESLERIRQLKRKVAAIDLPSSAKRLGASLSGGKLAVKCLGKDFIVDSKGNVTSDCHINEWIMVPLFNYVLSSAGKNVSGKWVPFRELKSGLTRNLLFQKSCEQPLKQIADTHMDLLKDIIYIFGGKPAVNSFISDISLILYPLPKIPIFINYCKPEDDLESKLNVFFDSTAEDNLNIESLYMLSAGLVTMFGKIALRHS